MLLNIFTILPLTCAVFVFLFGIFILVKDPNSRMNQLLTGFSLSMFFWMFGTFMMFSLSSSDSIAALFWDRFVYIGVVFMPPLMHHFSLLYTKLKGQRYLLYINYFLSFFFLAASRTSYFVDGLYVYSWGAHSKAQILHHIFLAYFFIGTGVFFYNLFFYFKRNKNSYIRHQTLLVFLAFAIVIFIGGSAYLYAYNIDTKFPFAYISGGIFPVMLFYVVSRYQLLGTKVIRTEILVGIALFVLTTEMFLSQNILELILRGGVTLIMAIVGSLLIRSVSNEVRRREEISKLAHSVEKANIRLTELDRQKTEFLSIASHQLRTPLSIIKGYTELIVDGAYGKVTKKLKGVLENIDQSNERLVKLVDEFLDISRIEQGRTTYSFTNSKINELIQSVISELTDRAEKKGLKIKWNKNSKITSVYMDEEKVRHIIFNYIDNAIKYSKKGTILIKTILENSGITIKVVDEGFGFGPEDEAAFFHKFYRGKNVEGVHVNGTGLGIYVCKKFAEAHGGKVWAHSPGPGKGSEFGFWIPKKRTKQHMLSEKANKEGKQIVVNQYDREKENF